MSSDQWTYDPDPVRVPQAPPLPHDPYFGGPQVGPAPQHPYDPAFAQPQVPPPYDPAFGQPQVSPVPPGQAYSGIRPPADYVLTPTKQSNSEGLWSLISGLAAFIILAPVLAIMGLLLGIDTLRRSDGSRKRGGALFAILGIIASTCAFALWVVTTVGASTDENSFNEFSVPLEPSPCVTGPNHVRVDCAEPHDGEIILDNAIAEAGEAYPGEEAIATRAEFLCTGMFEIYSGTPFEMSPYTYNYFVPSVDEWAAGERYIVCVARQPDGSSMPLTSIDR